MTDRIQFLRAALEEIYGGICIHERTVHVHETPPDLPEWKGDVEIFSLVGHPKTDKAFAWMWTTHTGHPRYITIPAIPPVSSAREAVLSALRSKVPDCGGDSETPTGSDKDL